MLRCVGAHLFGDEVVGVVGDAALDAAPGAVAEGDLLGLVLLVEFGQHFIGGARFVGRLEKLLQILFREAGDRDLAQSLVAGVDEDEVVAVAGVRARRRDVLGERVVVEFFVDDDPHVDAVRAHHGEESFRDASRATVRARRAAATRAAKLELCRLVFEPVQALPEHNREAE